MTVGELIAALEGLPLDRRVMLVVDVGTTGELQVVLEAVYGIGGRQVEVVELSAERE